MTRAADWEDEGGAFEFIFMGFEGFMRVCVYVCLYVFVSVYICVLKDLHEFYVCDMCVYVYMYVYVCICVYMWVYVCDTCRRIGTRGETCGRLPCLCGGRLSMDFYRC